MQYFQTVRPEISLKSLPANYIVTDGRDLYLRGHDDSLQRATDGQYAFAFVIELESVRKEVVRRMTQTERQLALRQA